MAENARIDFDITAWDEKPYDDLDGAPAVTRSVITSSYHGDLIGTGTAEMLMVYADDSSASYVGLERVVGTLGGRTGSFVLRHDGRYADGAARTTWTVVAGSGAGELRSLRGTGGFTAATGQHVEGAVLDYELADGEA